MAKHFTRQEMEEIRMQLAQQGMKDTDFIETDKFTGDDYFVIVQDGKNKKISADTFRSDYNEIAEQDHQTAMTDHQTAESDSAQAGRDHQTAVNDHAIAVADHALVAPDHAQADADSLRARQDHNIAVADHTIAVEDHNQAVSDSIESAEATTNAITAAALANAKAELVQDKLDIADQDHVRAESDHRTATTDHAIADGDHTAALLDHENHVLDHAQSAEDSRIAGINALQAQNDHTRAESDHNTALNDHTTAQTDHGVAVADHNVATDDHVRETQDHTRAETDHATAVQDHTTATADHNTAVQDHTTASSDHTRAESDHARAEQDHTASAAATGAANEAAQTATEAADAADAARESIEGELAKKANTDGYYGGMTVGSAENLVGRGSAEAGIQGIRTSAGQEDIGTGAAIIREVRGKSLVWNQLLGPINSNYWTGVSFATVTFNDGEATITLTKDAINQFTGYIRTKNIQFYTHKYYIAFDIFLSKGTSFSIDTNGASQTIAVTGYSTGTWNRTSTILSVSTEKSSNLNIYPRELTEGYLAGDYYKLRNAILIDLTLMFGAGSEPSTPEEFERMFPLPYYEYNTGTIINNEATGLRTRGFNLYNPVTGKAVLPGKYSDYPYEYEICGTFTSISFEDYAGNVSVPELSDGRFFNVDAPGVLTVVGGNATNTCVHLVWSGWRNYGEPDYVYEPYWENTLQINIKTITGKLNGEGESVVIFPNGMRGAGTAYDRLIVDPDGFARRAIVAMNSVDMGALTWAVDTAAGKRIFKAYVNGGQGVSSYNVANLVTANYSTVKSNELVNADKSIRGSFISSPNYTLQVGVYDLAYIESDAASFKSAMQGVLLNYELATHLEYILDTPIPLTYMVDDFGTEAKLPVDTAELPTGPLRFAVTYPFNAVDKLRRLPTNYLSKESTEAMLNALQSAGIIGGYTMTYNATTEQYTFTITAPSTTPDEITD